MSRVPLGYLARRDAVSSTAATQLEPTGFRPTRRRATTERQHRHQPHAINEELDLVSDLSVADEGPIPTNAHGAGAARLSAA